MIDAGILAEAVQQWFDDNNYQRREGKMSSVVLQRIMTRIIKEQEGQVKKEETESGIIMDGSENRLEGIYDEEDAICAMSGEDVGAKVFLQELRIQERKEFSFCFLRALDDIGLYEKDLYTFWNSCCSRNIRKAAELIVMFTEGELDAASILNWTRSGMKIEEIMKIMEVENERDKDDTD